MAGLPLIAEAPLLGAGGNDLDVSVADLRAFAQPAHGKWVVGHVLLVGVGLAHSLPFIAASTGSHRTSVQGDCPFGSLHALHSSHNEPI